MTTSRVKSAERVLDVLDLLARRGVPLATAEISSALELPKSTTHHLLNVMRDRRFVSYWADQRAWTLGVSAFEVGASYMRSGPLHREGQRFMLALTQSTDETSHLAVLQGSDVIYLDKREPLKPGVRLVTEIGTRLPAHLTAVGRAILSRLDAEQISALYEGYTWPTRTGTGPSTLAELRELLAAARESGYAVEENATTSGINCIAFLSGSKSAEESALIADRVRAVSAEFSADLGDRMVETPTADM